MGYDSNLKSAKSERRRRLLVFASVVAVVAAVAAVATLLRPASPPTGGAGPKVVGSLRTAAGGGNSPGAAKGMDPVAHKRSEEESAAAHKQLEEEAARARDELEAQVRAIKATGVIMEADPKSLDATKKLQDATRKLLALRYGPYGEAGKNFRVRLDLEFQPSIPDFDEGGKDGMLMFELAPISLIPCSVYNFLEIARTWKKGAFHRNANHVLQAMARSAVTQSMPFQEYSKEYPHKKGTVGYAGRPSGPEFYVSIQDNSRAHGPGSQQKHNPYEADCIIGKVIQGMADGTVDRIHKMPGREFLGDKKKWVWIRRMHILVPGEGPGGYVQFSSSPDVIPED